MRPNYYSHHPALMHGRNYPQHALVPRRPALMGAIVAAGSTVRVGFAYEIDNGAGWTPAEAPEVNDDPVYISDVIRGALLGSGVFAHATITVKPSAYFGVQDGYITIDAITYQDVGYPDEIGTLAQQIIREYLPAVRITRRDPVVIDAVPATAVNKGGVAQPDFQRYQTQTQTQPQQNQNQMQTQPGRCDWNKLDFGQWVACQLGLRDPLTGALAGATGAAIGIGAIALVGVALLKR